MKKLTILLLLTVSFLFSAPAMATIMYVDPVSGDDGTGDGSVGNPYKTIEFADNTLAGGDEVRVKKTAVQTASDTMTWTDGSATVNTTADETGNIVVRDVICKTSDFTGTEGWWYVSAITSSTITLTGPYYGSTETVTTYFMHDADNHSDQNDKSGTSQASRLKITGGWDLTGPTRDGYTLFAPSASVIALQLYVTNYIEVAYFVLTDSGSAGFHPFDSYITSGGYYHDIYTANNASCFSLDNVEETIVEDIISTGGSLTYGFLLSTARNLQLTDVNLYSPSSTLNAAFLISNTNFSFFDNVNVYTPYSHCFRFFGSSQSNYLKNCTAKGSIAYDGFYFETARYNRLYNCSAIDNNVYGVNFYANSIDNYIHNMTFSGNGTDINKYTSYDYGFFRGYQVTSAGVHTAYGPTMTLSSDTTDARSGTCIKVDPAHPDTTVTPYTLGTVKVASTATDLTLKIYIKEDGSFNGKVFLMALQNGEAVVVLTEKTPTTSYVEYTLVIDSGDLELNKYVDLKFQVLGTAGNIFFDDFSWSQ